MILEAALIAASAGLAGAPSPPARTTLSDPAIRYTVPDKGHVVVRRGDIEAIIADNRAIDDAVLPGHRGGYHGVAALRRGPGGRSLPSLDLRPRAADRIERLLGLRGVHPPGERRGGGAVKRPIRSCT